MVESYHRHSLSPQTEDCGYSSAGWPEKIPKPRAQPTGGRDWRSERGKDSEEIAWVWSGKLHCGGYRSQTVPETANLRTGDREAERKRITLSLCSFAPAALVGGLRLRWEGLSQAKFLRGVGFSPHLRKSVNSFSRAVCG